MNRRTALLLFPPTECIALDFSLNGGRVDLNNKLCTDLLCIKSW